MKSVRDYTDWYLYYSYDGHKSSVNSIIFDDPKNGFRLATCSTDGSISIINDPISINVGNFTLNAVDFLDNSTLITGGKGGDLYTNEAEIEKIDIEGHTDTLRDVKTSPSVTKEKWVFTCGDDLKVIMWGLDEDGGLVKKQEYPVKSQPWRIEWAVSGNRCNVHTVDEVYNFWRAGGDKPYWRCHGQEE